MTGAASRTTNGNQYDNTYNNLETQPKSDISTVKHLPPSSQKYSWEEVMDYIITTLSDRAKHTESELNIIFNHIKEEIGRFCKGQPYIDGLKESISKADSSIDRNKAKIKGCNSKLHKNKVSIKKNEYILSENINKLEDLKSKISELEQCIKFSKRKISDFETKIKKLNESGKDTTESSKKLQHIKDVLLPDIIKEKSEHEIKLQELKETIIESNNKLNNLKNQSFDNNEKINCYVHKITKLKIYKEENKPFSKEINSSYINSTIICESSKFAESARIFLSKFPKKNEIEELDNNLTSELLSYCCDLSEVLIEYLKEKSLTN